jgi:lactoylglutathione lyase
MGRPDQARDLRAFPIVYASDVERAAQFWELLGFRRHVQLPADGEPGYVGLRRGAAGPEMAISNGQWATDRYGLSMGDGPRFEMYIYVADLDGMLSQLAEAAVPILRRPEDMPWGERIATVADTEGNPIALCQQT